MPDYYSLHLNKAREFYDDGNYEATRMAASHAIESSQPGRDTEARVIMALALKQMQLNDEAFNILDEVVQKFPTPEAQAEYALMRAERGLCDETCMTCIQKALDEDADLSSAYIAKFWCLAAQNDYVEALQSIIRGLHRGADFSEVKLFEIVRDWCQDACNNNDFQLALQMSSTVTDYFNTFDFLVLHARLSEFANDPRTAVKYYKKAIVFLRPGPMRTDILEAIARIAI